MQTLQTAVKGSIHSKFISQLFTDAGPVNCLTVSYISIGEIAVLSSRVCIPADNGFIFLKIDVIENATGVAGTPKHMQKYSKFRCGEVWN